MISIMAAIMYEGRDRVKVIAINGSPRKNGNVTRCLEIMAKEFEKEGIEFEAL